MPSFVTSNPQIGGQPLFSSSSVQLHALGEKMVMNDSRVYRYCLAGGTTLVAGKLQQAAAEKTNHQNLTPSAAAAAATSVTVTLGATAATANYYANGWILTTVTPDVGQMYRIKSHPAANASATLTLTLDDAIVAAWTASTRADLVPNPFSSVVVNPTTATSAPVGVAIYAITNAEYGWLQTYGPTNVLADGAVTVGAQVDASNAVAGAVESLTGAQAIIGTALTGIADTEYGAVFVTLG